MEPDKELNPDTDDLPLCANTNHILVRHYALDLTVHFDRKVISGSVVLFLEPCSRSEDGHAEGSGTQEAEIRFQDVDAINDGARDWDQTGAGTASGDQERSTIRHTEGFGNATGMKTIFSDPTALRIQAEAEAENIQSSHWWESTNDGYFTLVLDCCDLAVSKVEEVDVTCVSAMSSHLAEISSESAGDSSVCKHAALVQNLISMSSTQWRQQHQLFSLCSRAPGAQDGSSLHFHTDRWSLQVRKRGVTSPQEFPRVLRICYETRPTGGSVRWTKDQDNRWVMERLLSHGIFRAPLGDFKAGNRQNIDFLLLDLKCNILSLP